jgi:hypothetical protein
MTQTYCRKATRTLQSKKLHSFKLGRVKRAAEIRRQLALRKNFERFLFRRLNTVFRRFILTQLYLYREYGVYIPEAAVLRLNEEFRPVMLSFYRRLFVNAYTANNAHYDKFTKNTDVVVFGQNVVIEELVAQYYAGKELILAGITQRLANRIQQEIELGRIDGLGVAAIAKNIRDKIIPLSRSRAQLIARTEAHNALGFAQHSYHKTVQGATGQKLVKQWAATLDGRTRSHHSSANGQTVDMDSDFIVNGAPMSYVGDPRGGASNVINCRCVILYTDEEDIVLN